MRRINQDIGEHEEVNENVGKHGYPGVIQNE